MDISGKLNQRECHLTECLNPSLHVTCVGFEKNEFTRQGGLMREAIKLHYEKCRLQGFPLTVEVLY